MKEITRMLFLLFSLLIATTVAPAQQSRIVDDKSVEVLHLESLSYPPLASRFAQGVVVVQVKLADNGSVADAIALSGSPILARASVENAKKWRFKPNSERAAILVYNFRIEGSCAPGSWSSQMIFYPPNFATITACGSETVP